MNVDVTLLPHNIALFQAYRDLLNLRDSFGFWRLRAYLYLLENASCLHMFPMWSFEFERGDRSFWSIDSSLQWPF